MSGHATANDAILAWLNVACSALEAAADCANALSDQEHERYLELRAPVEDALRVATLELRYGQLERREFRRPK